MVLEPLSLVLAIVALFRDDRKVVGICALCLSVPAVALMLYGVLMAFACGG